MEKYHKIKTLFERDPNDKYKTVKENIFATQEFETLKNALWVWTEKIDGTNIRVIWDGQNLEFRGKSDRAQIPPDLLEVLDSRFSEEKMLEAFGENSVCLYGEGYGNKIQKHGDGYIKHGVDFILFDVWVSPYWLEREKVESIANKLEIDVVPIVGEGTMEKAKNLVKNGFVSNIAQQPNFLAEGIVMEPKGQLYNRKGERIISKLKHSDFKRES